MAEFQYLLDSDICIYLLKDFSPTLTAKVAAQGSGSLCISSISLAEIAVGYGNRVFNAPELRSFLGQIPAVAFDERAAKIFGALPFRRGKFDRLIAAHALSLDVVVVTNNEADFADVPGLRTENWAG